MLCGGPIPLFAGISEEVYFLGDGAQELPQSVLLHLTETKPFGEFAHKHSFRRSWLERWNWFGWMMHDRILSGSRYAQRKCARSSVMVLDRTLE